MLVTNRQSLLKGPLIIAIACTVLGWSVDFFSHKTTSNRRQKLTLSIAVPVVFFIDFNFIVLMLPNDFKVVGGLAVDLLNYSLHHVQTTIFSNQLLPVITRLGFLIDILLEILKISTPRLSDQSWLSHYLFKMWKKLRFVSCKSLSAVFEFNYLRNYFL